MLPLWRVYSPTSVAWKAPHVEHITKVRPQVYAQTQPHRKRVVVEKTDPLKHSSLHQAVAAQRNRVWKDRIAVFQPKCGVGQLKISHEVMLAGRRQEHRLLPLDSEHVNRKVTRIVII